MAGVDDFISLLRETPLFQAISDDGLRALRSQVEVITLHGGELLIQQGDTDDRLYLLLSGRLRAVRTSSEGKEQILGDITPGETVGEMAILGRHERSATVRAIRDSELVQFSRTAFEKLVTNAPEVAIHLARLLVTRLQQVLAGPSVPTAPRTIAIIPRDAGVPIAAFSARFAGALSCFDTTCHVTRARAAGQLGHGTGAMAAGRENGRLLEWFQACERDHRFVVYEAELSGSAWTDQCVRQADQVVIVGNATSTDTGGPSAWERTSARRDLVVLREGGGAVSAVAPAIEAHRPALHHHIAATSDTDFERLTRLVTNRAVGVVLGGGGARAFAHIGVLRALAEASIAVDMIGGTSMGAVMAAQYASGWDHATMMAETRKAFVESRSLFDYTLPFMSLIGGRRFVRLLSTMFGETRIEDLPLKYFCVSTNLTRGETMVHESGPLAKWLCASISVPGLAPPVFHDGSMFSDGSVLNTVPADVMRGFGRGKVIAVDVTARVDVSVDRAYRETPTASQVLWSRLNPFAATLHVPSIYRILLRTTMLNSLQSVERLQRTADLYIHPPVERVDTLNWKALARAVELGYTAAQKALSEWTDDRGGSDRRPGAPR